MSQSLDRRRFLQTTALGVATLYAPAVLRAQGAPVKVGILQPVSGALSYSGQQGRIGATLALEEINAAGIKSLGGAKIEPVMGDAQSTPEGGNAEVEKMNAAGVCAIVSQERQENFSRTCWITFQHDGTCSNVSVTSSPILRNVLPPQHGHAVGAGWTTRSRGRCSGNGRRAGRLRRKPFTPTFVSAAAAAAAGKTRQAMDKLYKKGLAKLGKKAVQKMGKPQALPTDRRGQAIVPDARAVSEDEK